MLNEQTIEPGKLYRHFKGEIYVVVGEGIHTESCEELVIYHPLHNPNRLFVRPKSMFFDKVPAKYPTYQGRRFVPVDRDSVLNGSEDNG